MDLLPAAVANNVAWCGLVCPGRTDEARGVWTAAGTPASLFPDVVTLRPGVSAQALAERLADRASCSVKDSYADVDLAPHGFTVLFTARWIGVEDPVAGAAAGWSRVTAAAALATWCAAADLPATLPVDLLAEPAVRVLGLRRGGHLVGGAIVNVGAGVVGVSNVFGTEADVWSGLGGVAGAAFPGLPVVGYEHGGDLAAAVAAGFGELGPVRVWVR